MIWAIRDGARVQAEPRSSATCPCCGGDVVPKCGRIVTHHWAHRSNDCDPWYEPETAWHFGWKRKFPEEWQEVVIGRHRADVKTPLFVVELQKSTISSEDIEERESFYRNMVWVLRGEDFWKNLNFRQRDGFVSFRWKHPRKSWWFAKRPIYIDPGSCEWGPRSEPYWGEGEAEYLEAERKREVAHAPGMAWRRDNRCLFEIKKLHQSVPCGGWGVFVPEATFMRRIGCQPEGVCL